MNHHMAQKHAKYNYKGTTPKSHYTSIYHNNIVSDIMFVYNKLWSVAFFTRYACKPWDGSYPYLVSFPFYIYIQSLYSLFSNDGIFIHLSPFIFIF